MEVQKGSSKRAWCHSNPNILFLSFNYNFGQKKWCMAGNLPSLAWARTSLSSSTVSAFLWSSRILLSAGVFRGTYKRKVYMNSFVIEFGVIRTVNGSFGLFVCFVFNQRISLKVIDWEWVSESWDGNRAIDSIRLSAHIPWHNLFAYPSLNAGFLYPQIQQISL